MRIPGVGATQTGAAGLGYASLEEERKARRRASKDATRQLYIQSAGAGLNALSNVGRTVADFQSIAAREREGAAQRELDAALDAAGITSREKMATQQEQGLDRRQAAGITSEEGMFGTEWANRFKQLGQEQGFRARENSEDRRVTTEQGAAEREAAMARLAATQSGQKEMFGLENSADLYRMGVGQDFEREMQGRETGAKRELMGAQNTFDAQEAEKLRAFQDILGGKTRAADESLFKLREQGEDRRLGMTLNAQSQEMSPYQNQAIAEARALKGKSIIEANPTMDPGQVMTDVQRGQMSPETQQGDLNARRALGLSTAARNLGFDEESASGVGNLDYRVLQDLDPDELRSLVAELYSTQGEGLQDLLKASGSPKPDSWLRTFFSNQQPGMPAQQRGVARDEIDALIQALLSGQEGQPLTPQTSSFYRRR